MKLQDFKIGHFMLSLKRAMILMWVVSVLLAGTVTADVITPTAAYSRTGFGAPRSAAQLIISSRESGDQFMAGYWNPASADAWPFANGGGDCDQEWVYIDLGAEYDLDEIRLWNGDYGHSANDQMGWRTKNISIHVAGAGAVLPTGYYVDGVSTGEVPTATDCVGISATAIESAYCCIFSTVIAPVV